MIQPNITKIKTHETASIPEDIELVFNKNKTRGFKYLKISKENVKLLEDCFSQSIYPSKEFYLELAVQTKLPITKIENWFKFQRKKHLGLSDNNKYQKRRILKCEEERILEDHFRENQNPSYETLKELAALLGCKKKQVRNWFAYRRKKLNKLRRKKSGPKNYFSRDKESKKENKADSSSLESNKIFLEDKNSTSSTSNQNSNQNTKKELSNNESSENKVNSYDSQMKTELNASYAMKNNAINNNNSQDENNLTQNTENTDQKMSRMNQNNQPQIIFTNKPYFNQQPFNNIYYNNSFNNQNQQAIFMNNGYSKFAFIPTNMGNNMSFANNQYRTYNMLVPINQAVNMNMGFYPMMPVVGNQNQLKMGQNGNQWLANVSNERSNGTMCMNEMKQNDCNMNTMNSNDMNR